MRKITYIVFYLIFSSVVAQESNDILFEKWQCVGLDKSLCVNKKDSKIHLKTKDGWIEQWDDTLSLRWTSEPFYYLQTDLDQIDMESAWSYTTGGVNALGDSISIAVIDASFDVSHEDLIDNIWKNPGEIPEDSIDNDLNGYIDDVFGLQLINENDNHNQGAISNHGTSVLGIIGAVGNNQIGVSGVCQSCKLMLLSARGDQEIIQLSTILKGFEYIIEMKKAYLRTDGQEGAFVVAVNCSWGIDYAYAKDHPVWCSLLDSLGAYGIIPVSAVTNNDVDIDVVGDMPSDCSSDFLITVHESNDRGQLKTGTGYGLNNVDLASPGSAYTTRWANKYGVFGGTSGATPHVTAAIGLLSSLPIPRWNYFQREQPAEAAKLMKKILLSTVDEDPTLKEKSASGGEINVGRAMDYLYNYFTPSPSVGINAIFPQPANDILNVRISSTESTEVNCIFYDLLGRPSIQSGSQITFAGQPYIEIDVSDLSAGIYMMEVQLDTQKFASIVTINK